MSNTAAWFAVGRRDNRPLGKTLEEVRARIPAGWTAPPPPARHLHVLSKVHMQNPAQAHLLHASLLESHESRRILERQGALGPSPEMAEAR